MTDAICQHGMRVSRFRALSRFAPGARTLLVSTSLRPCFWEPNSPRLRRRWFNAIIELLNVRGVCSLTRSESTRTRRTFATPPPSRADDIFCSICFILFVVFYESTPIPQLLAFRVVVAVNGALFIRYPIKSLV